MTSVATPALLLLDVNETLSDLSPMADTFVDIGLERGQAATWFATVLREGFAVAVTGGLAPFADVGTAVAQAMLRAAGADAGDADRVLETFTGLDVHPDVATGLPRLAAAGVRLVTLSNGSASVAESLLERAGLADVVEATLSVEDAGIWKPAADSYHWALERLGVEPGDAALAAVHPWDVHGAVSAGLSGVLVDRGGVAPAPYLAAPSLTVTGFDDLAERWA